MQEEFTQKEQSAINNSIDINHSNTTISLESEKGVGVRSAYSYGVVTAFLYAVFALVCIVFIVSVGHFKKPKGVPVTSVPLETPERAHSDKSFSDVGTEKSGVVTGTYYGFMNDAVFIKTENITLDEAIENCRINKNNNQASSVRCTWNGEEITVTVSTNTSIASSPAPSSLMPVKAENGTFSYGTDVYVAGPKKNIMSCHNPPVTGLGSGSTVCYGIWDSGEEFGGDVAMCPDREYVSGQRTGCVIRTPACKNFEAVATSFINPSSLGYGQTDLYLIQEVAKKLGTSEGVVRKNILGLWTYSCK